MKFRLFLAKIFKILFKNSYLKRKYFGIHKKLFRPLNLFKDVVCVTNYNGLQLIVHIDDWIQGTIYFLGAYEKPELKALEKFITPKSTCIDLGANFGLYTLYISKLIDENGKIISFEPFTKNYTFLIKNIALNKLTNIQTERLAVGKKEGITSLYYNEKEKNLGMVSTNYTCNAITEEVNVVALDSYFKNNAINHLDFIKIDIEGAEYNALLGMKNILTVHSPTLLIEILEDYQQPNNSEKIHTFLSKLGYQKYFIDNEGNLSKTEINPERKNYIFTKKAQYE